MQDHTTPALTDGVYLEIGHWPGRKRPLLTLHSPKDNKAVILATFKDDDAYDLFRECLKRGVRSGVEGAV
jgi:hypothetical protein